MFVLVVVETFWFLLNKYEIATFPTFTPLITDYHEIPAAQSQALRSEPETLHG